jgi:Tfp pilus assembly protein PilV
MRGRAERRGVKLVELVIACMIFSTVMVSLAALWSYNGKSFHQSNTQMLANNLAREMLEKARAARYEGLPTLVAEMADAPEVSLSSRRRGQEVEIRLSRRLVFRNDTPVPGTREVTAMVQWTSGHQEHSLRLVTYLARTM